MNTTGDREAGTGKGPSGFSRWIQRTMNARTSTKIRKGKARMMGMDVLVLHTVGRLSGEPRTTPLAWFPDGDSRVVVASGGGDANPDWYSNLVAHPDRVAIGLPGEDAVPVVAETLVGADREQAWQRVIAAQPRIGKYQSKSQRTYPVVRLTPRRPATDPR